MAVSKRAPDLAGTIARIGDDTPGLSAVPEMDTDAATEAVVAPAVDGAATLSYSPLVESNLTLTSTDTEGAVTTYVHGIDYVQTISPAGFTNLAIPEGTQLTADYFYYAAGPVTELSGGGESAMSYASLLKAGL